MAFPQLTIDFLLAGAKQNSVMTPTRAKLPEFVPQNTLVDSSDVKSAPEQNYFQGLFYRHQLIIAVDSERSKTIICHQLSKCICPGQSVWHTNYCFLKPGFHKITRCRRVLQK